MRNDLDIPFPETGAAIGEPYGRSSYAGRTGMDPNTRRLAIIAGSIGGALLLLVGVWSAIGPRHGGIPVIEADSRPVRERPVNKGGLTVVGADESGLSADSDAKAVVAPAPEAPALAALKAAPSAAPAAAPTTVANAVPDAAAVPAGPREVPPSTFGAPVPSAPPASAVASAPIPPAQRVALNTTTPAATPAAAPTPLASLPAARPAPTGNAQVQLAAVGSEEAAQTEWQRLSRKLPDLLGNRRPVVSHTERDGKTYWRVRTGGFADVASATTFCNQVRAKGGSCSLASF